MKKTNLAFESFLAQMQHAIDKYTFEKSSQIEKIASKKGHHKAELKDFFGLGFRLDFGADENPKVLIDAFNVDGDLNGRSDFENDNVYSVSGAFKLVEKIYDMTGENERKAKLSHKYQENANAV